ncbi:hypothetical protein IGI04_010343 [Brassica rapa subsp. trilocularis]|uniref:Uncharacterized protein n=1 Tax=Brassica rapa subsp. trilocularis TaxID=1813537 RepID=A0ABQ7MZX5_BRACM|nr:hypothetical protein IGI04_010343 [Brassica rapa subsp. trilocularis]
MSHGVRSIGRPKAAAFFTVRRGEYKAAVLICHFEGDDGDWLFHIFLYQVAKQKSHDKGLLQTIEAEEEIGLDASLVDYTSCVIKTRRAILCKSKSFDLKGKLILGDYGSTCVVL